jgi:hypothetical protein
MKSREWSMRLVRSSARRTERRTTAAVQTVAFVCVLVCSLAENPAAQGYPQFKSSAETKERFRFQVTNPENYFPIPGAAVSLIYRQKKATAEEKKEIDAKTDKDCLAEFPRIHSDRLAVSVTVNGYRSCWRWIRPDRSREPIRLRTDRWVTGPQ